MSRTRLIGRKSDISSGWRENSGAIMCVNQPTSLTGSDQQWAAHSCHTAALYTPAVSDPRL